MPVFVHLGTLTDQGIRNLKDLPDGVRQAFAGAEKQGIKLHGYYLTEGRYDFVAIVEAPDEHAGLGAHLSALSNGDFRTETLRAHTLDDFDQIIGNMR
jgi:uncharacterized protein with GYD domain